MNKKFLIGLVLLLGLIPQFLFSQVKSYVGVVRQQYYSEYVDMFKAMSKELKDEGYNTYAKSIDGYLEGGFGSGFVWVAPNGTNYIITNRHVVAQAETASVEFEDDATGEITKYEGLKVVATDDDIDIAILAFKDGEKPFKKGLSLSEKALTDGQEVWSAGYPGLGNDPVWQFGKGTVTNARARIKELLDPEVSTIIQHSAQVDSGNSGGPLLIASGKDYLVVGINTWKAAYRDSTNFAIPASVIKKMIDGISSSDKPSVEDRAFKLAKALGDSSQNYTSIVSFISYHKAAVDGQTDLESILRFAPTSIRSTISEIFNYNPAEGLRYACAYQLFKKYGSTEDKTYSYKTEVKESGAEKTSITFTSGEEENPKTFETVWIQEHGLWRLDVNEAEAEEESKNSKDKKKKEKKSGGVVGFSPLSPLETFVIKIDIELPLTGQDKSFGGELQFYTSELVGFGVVLTQVSNEVKNTFAVGLSGILRVPLAISSFVITPYAEVGYNMAGLGTFDVQLSVLYEAGLGVSFDIGSTFYPGLGVAYRGRKFMDFMDDSFTGTTSAVLIYISLGF
ncbi:MAG: trypsin-like peptidase domain-containing protein [Treponema sp.]|nr:trypsin-like peptidase domain-containing protein [Treponema sp.]